MDRLPPRDAASPERTVRRLRRRLCRHRAWDRLLAVLPPLGVVAYLCAALVARDLAGPATVAFALAAAGGAALAALSRPGLGRPSSHEAARLLDERTGADERFLTWMTLDRARAHPAFVARLGEQVSALSGSVELGRDFPYRAGRGVPVSLLTCGALAVLVHLSLETPAPSTPSSTVAAAGRSAQFRLQGIARSVEAGAVGLWRRVEGRFAAVTDDEQVSGPLRRGRGEGRGAQGQAPAGVGDAATVEPGPASSPGAIARTLGPAYGPDAVARTPGQAGGSDAPARTPEPAGGPEAAARTHGKGGERVHGLGGEGGSPSPRVAGRRGAGRAAGKERTSRTEDPFAKGASGRRDGVPASSWPRDLSSGKGSSARRGGAPAARGSEVRRLQGLSDGLRGASAGRGSEPGREPDRFHPPGKGGEDGPEGARFVTVMLPRAPAVGAPRGVASGSDVAAAVPFANAPLPPRRPPELAAERQRLPLEYGRLIE